MTIQILSYVTPNDVHQNKLWLLAPCLVPTLHVVRDATARVRVLAIQNHVEKTVGRERIFIQGEQVRRELVPETFGIRLE